MSDKTVTGMISEMDRRRILRDSFAMAALTGIIAKSPYKSGTLAEMRASGDLEARAAAAYDYADAMMEARK